MSALQGCSLCHVESKVYIHVLKHYSYQVTALQIDGLRILFSEVKLSCFLLWVANHLARKGGYDSFKIKTLVTLFLVLYSTASCSPSAGTLNCSLLQGDNVSLQETWISQ